MRQVLIPHHVQNVPPALGGRLHSLSGHSMGTRWSIKLVVGRADVEGGWTAGVQAQLDAVVAQMSTWDAASNLSRFNEAPAGSWHELPPEFDEVLRFGLEMAELSGGACDPTVGALVDRWGFGPAPRFDQAGFRPPSDAEVEAARTVSGWQRLEVDRKRCRVRQPGGLRLDLSAIAKGFAVDQVMRHLASRGVENALVEVGGELLGRGLKPDGQPWWVGLEAPDPRAAATGLHDTVLALHGLAVATSGDYRRFYQLQGRRQAHTLDPRSGRPVQQRVASVSVVHPRCMAADAWSTALTVLGLDEGLALANAHGIAARFVLRASDDAPLDGQRAALSEHLSRPFQALLS